MSRSRGGWIIRSVPPLPDPKLLEKEVVRLEQECARQQALVRATQRTIGLAHPPAAKPAAKVGKATGKQTRKRRSAVRALKAAAALRATSVSENDGELSASAAVGNATTEYRQQPLTADHTHVRGHGSR